MKLLKYNPTVKRSPVKAIGVLFAAAVSAATGYYLGIVIFWVGGISEVVRGFNATPNNGGEIGWGIVKALVFGDLFLGAGLFAGCLLAILSAAMFGLGKIKSL